MDHVDGNALAGALTLAFGTEMTAAISQCANCGHRHPFAEAHVYLRCPGMVMRCPTCSELEIVIIDSNGRLHLTVGGVASISLRTID